MKQVIKGMIIFFSLLLLGLVGLLAYGLTRGTDGLFLAGSSNRFSGISLVSTQTFELTDVSMIAIKNYSSDIFFLPSDDETLVVKEYVSNKRTQSPFVTVKHSGYRLNIEADRYNSSSWIVFGSNYRCIEIYLPASYRNELKAETGSGDIFSDLDLTFTKCSLTGSSSDISLAGLTAETVSVTTSSGDILIERLNGEKKIETQSGTVSIGGGSGDAEISSSSGDIKLEGIEGHVRINTASGDMWVNDLTGSADAASSSGDIRLMFASLTGNLDIESSSGTVYCELPKDISFKFHADTSSGDIRTYFDDTLSFNRRGTQAEGEVGDLPDLKATVKTSSGDIKFIGK